MDRKKLIMVGGPGGVGKTTVCRELFKKLNGSAWLDADWCWMVNPYPGKTPEQKKYAEAAFGYILNGYLDDVNTKVILFCWAMHRDFMFDLVTDYLKEKDYELTKIVLVCSSKEIYIDRLKKDNRREEQIKACEADDMQLYYKLNAHIIDMAYLTISEVAEKIIGIAHIH